MNASKKILIIKTIFFFSLSKKMNTLVLEGMGTVA
jgi:hypothetical protein